MPSPPSTQPPDRSPSWVAVTALVFSIVALLLIALDGACRPEPVPVGPPAPGPSSPDIGVGTGGVRP